MDKNETIDAILFLALGIEKLMKGILYDLNPVYVFIDQDFKNTVSILHKDRLLNAGKQNKEVSVKPNEDVLSFRLSLARSLNVSNTINKHKSLLYRLSTWRDIIAHNELEKLELDKCNKLLQRDLYTFIEDFSNEIGVNIDHLLGSSSMKLAEISAENQDDVGARIEGRIKIHKSKWTQLMKVPGYVEKMELKTDLAINSTSTRFDTHYETIDCPACNNQALLTIEIDFDVSEGQAIPIGVFISKLKCHFCKLTIEEYDEMDYLNLNELLIEEEDNEYM